MIPRVHKTKRVESLILECVAEFLARESNRTSLITATDIQLTRDKRCATISLSVLPDTESAKAVAFANRKAPGLYDFIRSRVRLRTIPRVRFVSESKEKSV